MSQSITIEAQQKLLELVFSRADALNGFWNLYIAVSLGLLGLMASAKPFTEVKAVKVLLSVAFVAFAYANYDVIAATNVQRSELLKLLAGSIYLPAAQHARPPTSGELAAFHGILDALVLALVWLVPWHSVRGQGGAA